MIIHGDILEWAASYKGPKFHALLCDPPYHLVSGNAVPDVKQCVQCNRVLGGADGSPLVCPRCGGALAGQRKRAGGGFMGKKWDGGDIAFDPATWAALGEHMHPGAFGMAFASSRGWHRLACAIEDAGMVLHPSVFVFGYVFGSGFPKATRVKDAKAFAGHRYGMQCLKPAIEPVIVFQKPYAGKPVECIVRTGAGALWVDGGRIGCTDKAKFPYGVVSRTESTYGNGKGVYDDRERPNDSNPSGRWPANFALIHSPNCNGECAPECAVRRLGEQSGDTSQGHWTHKRNIGGNGIYGGGGYADNDEGRKLADTGTAARYFFQAQWDQLDAADPVKYQAKASRRERDAGLDGMPERIGGTMDGGAIVSDGRNAPKTGRILVRNPHPTVKPIALIEHLATLLLPPAEYAPRRIMIPFAGSGSEMIGATLAGWDEVVGIEREVEYVEIAEKRLAYWREQREEKVKEAESQMSLLEAVG